MSKAQKRKISKKDWASVGSFISNELQSRKTNKFRKLHERIWSEVDRQVQMSPIEKISKNPSDEQDWHAALELGELSRASEILSADIRRITFPQNRAWFEAHSEIDYPLDEETGEPLIDQRIQRRVDGGLRALMTQQHIDFGLKGRVDLSVKEALHHGSYVVTVENKTMMEVHSGTGIKMASAPAWMSHSMWNCYPDSSQSIMGTNMFYNGSMIICSFMKWVDLQNIKEDGYFNLKQVPKTDNDIEIATYYGDVTISRQGDDVYLPNSIVKAVNGTVIYYKPNDLPFSGVIYNGYEKLDVRDPYYVSPLTKMSPTQKLASILANKFVDGVKLWAEPPLVYDSNDPEFAMNGGPTIAPGAKTPTKGSANYKEMKIGDPSAALSGLQFTLDQIQKGTSVDNLRSGVSAGVEQTATEVIKTSQGGEIRTIDFVDKHELHGLRPFLYLQHLMNKKTMKPYSFYNPEMDAPDFETADKNDLPDNVHFEIVGSKGLLGEEQRQQKTMMWTQFLLSNPATANMVNLQEIAKQGYQDAGNKNPERFLNISDEQQMFEQQIEEIIAQAQEQIGALQQEIAGYQFQDEEHSLELEQKELEKEQLQTVIEGLKFANKVSNEKLSARTKQ